MSGITRSQVNGGVIAALVTSIGIVGGVVYLDDGGQPQEIRIIRENRDTTPVIIEVDEARELLGCQVIRVTQQYIRRTGSDGCPLIQQPRGGSSLETDFRTALRANCLGTLTVTARCSPGPAGSSSR